MTETPMNAQAPDADWVPGRQEERANAAAAKAARLYQNAVLICGFAAAVTGALAWADYLFAILTPFLRVTAGIGLALAAAGLGVFLAACKSRAGRLPPLGSWGGMFLLSLAVMPALVTALAALTNAWLDRSAPVPLETTVISRYDAPHGTEYSGRSRSFRMHEAYVHVRADLPGGADLQLPGDYISTRGLQAGDKYGVHLRKGFWGLAHIAIIR
jgi:hypothetical protein